MKAINLFLALFALTLTTTAFAKVTYVSDDLTIFLHAGPSTEYRIIGAPKVGVKLTVLAVNNETGFTKVKTNKGKIGWVKSSQVNSETPSRKQLEYIQKKLSNAHIEIKNIDKINVRSLNKEREIFAQGKKTINDLKVQTIDLEKKITLLESKNLELDLLQDTKAERVKMEWMMFGGSVFFGGLVCGLLIPFLPRRQRKNKQSW